MRPVSAWLTWPAYWGTKTTNSEPSTAPATVPRPPTTIAPRKVKDSSRVNDSGATKPSAYAKSAPPTPAKAALQAKSSALTRAASTP
jgi:hypothetical protein